MEGVFDLKSENVDWSHCPRVFLLCDPGQAISLSLSEPWFPSLLSTCHVLGKIYNLFSHHSSIRLALLAQFHSGGLLTLLNSYRLPIGNEIPTRICLVPKNISYCHPKIVSHHELTFH